MQISARDLAAELLWCQRFIWKKSTIPILQNVLFEVQGNRLTLTANNLEFGGITALEGRGKKKGWAVTIPVGKLIKYLGNVDEDEVTLAPTEAHWLEVKHGTAATKIAGMSKESYPELPTPPPEPQIMLGGLAVAIDRTAFAVSPEESRFTPNGMLLEGEKDEARLVATDGHRISVAPFPVKGAPKFRALIPKKALLEAARLVGDCGFSQNDDFVFLDYGQRKILTRKLTGTFPDIERVIPKDIPNHVMIPVKATLKTLDRVALYADARSRAVRFNIVGANTPGAAYTLTAFASCVEDGEATGDVTIQPGTGGAGPLEIGLNADYVKEFLSRNDEEFVAFGYSDNKSSIEFITGGRWCYLLMPIRID